MKKIVLTGGGSAGHVTPNLALLPALAAAGYETEYTGGKNGIEKELAQAAGIPYHGIPTGKLRRDKLLSLKNISDAFESVKGVGEAYALLGRIKPDVIFSKGGFVSVPIAVAGRMRGIPVILHESDVSPGLANRLSAPFAGKICVTFPETLPRFGKKAVLTGTPIRRELFAGNADKGLRLAGLSGTKPVVLVTGGSLGAASVNNKLREALPDILPSFDVIHLCGKGKTSDASFPRGYKQFEYLNTELPDVLAACAVVVSRAGSNTINELLALRLPSLLIPLANKASRGDQVLNAESFQKRGFSIVLTEDGLTPATLADGIKKLYADRRAFISRMEASPQNDGISEVMKIINLFPRRVQ